MTGAKETADHPKNRHRASRYSGQAGEPVGSETHPHDGVVADSPRRPVHRIPLAEVFNDFLLDVVIGVEPPLFPSLHDGTFLSSSLLPTTGNE